MNRADLVTPFWFYAELLGAGDGRRRLLARLGRQASKPIDEFLAATLNYEREAAARLQGFLLWFDDHAGVVKRDLEQGRDEVRILTLHGTSDGHRVGKEGVSTCGSRWSHYHKKKKK